jgi:formamidopyrimidine-DNA glycosylase
MPELPEVETMVRGLRPALSGRTVRRLEVLDPTMVHGCAAGQLARRGRGATVVGVTRRGKWVVVELAGDRGIIVIQPRMTGGFWLVDPRRPEHIRLAFHLDNPRATVWYCDTRRLGRICWFAGPEAAARAFARSHGPDALEIGRDELAGRLARTARHVR